MKRGFYFVASLAFLALFAVPLFAQAETRSYGRTETIAIDEFDTTDGQTYTWKTAASRFVSEGYPRMQYFLADGTGPDGVREPFPLRSFKPERDKKQVLGLEVKYNRKADNWFELYPVPAGGGDDAFRGVPMEGRVTQINMWVWGTNYKYFLDVVVRDVNGRIFVLPAGSLNFQGWKNIVVPVPAYIKQEDRIRSAFKNLFFVGLRVRTSPSEFVDNFAVFFDHLQYTTYQDSNFYDGSELKYLNFDAPANGGAQQ